MPHPAALGGRSAHYDLLDTRPGKAERTPNPHWVTDQRFVMQLFDSGLVYHSAPFATETEITGWVKLVLWLALDVPDTDFQAVLAEILPDGSHIRLSDDFLRARYRDGLTAPKLVEPGAINRYEFKGFT